MKYFKPELLTQCRSLDETVAETSAKEWEEAVTAYQTRYKILRPQLPAAVRRLCSRFSLHDAKMLGAAFATEKALFSLLLQPEVPSGHSRKILELNYRPVAGVNGGINIKALLSIDVDARHDVWVLYDEFDIDEQHGFFTHLLLLTNGREIEIRFNGLNVRLLDEVITPVQLTQGERKWPTVEIAG